MNNNTKNIIILFSIIITLTGTKINCMKTKFYKKPSKIYRPTTNRYFHNKNQQNNNFENNPCQNHASENRSKSENSPKSNFRNNQSLYTCDLEDNVVLWACNKSCNINREKFPELFEFYYKSHGKELKFTENHEKQCYSPVDLEELKPILTNILKSNLSELISIDSSLIQKIIGQNNVECAQLLEAIIKRFDLNNKNSKENLDLKENHKPKEFMIQNLPIIEISLEEESPIKERFTEKSFDDTKNHNNTEICLEKKLSEDKTLKEIKTCNDSDYFDDFDDLEKKIIKELEDLIDSEQ